MVDNVRLVLVFRTVITAFETAEPDGSLTAPETVACISCASDGAATKTAKNETSDSFTERFPSAN
jgi:hypothetical protein